MLEQTRNAIEKLKNAGLERSQFSVRASRRFIGKNPVTGRHEYEYGDAKIRLRDVEENWQLANKLAVAGLHVELYMFDNHQCVFVDDEWGKRGLLETLDLRGDRDMYDAVKEKKETWVDCKKETEMEWLCHV